MTTHVQSQMDLYQSGFESYFATRVQAEPAWMLKRRRVGIERFAQLGLPAPRDEQWRQTDVEALTTIAFEPTAWQRPVTLSRRDVAGYTIADACATLVFVNGRYAPDLSTSLRLPDGLRVEPLTAVAQSEPPTVEPHIGAYAAYCGDNPYVAMNTAFMQDGACIRVASGCVMAQPIVLLFVTTGMDTPKAVFPRNLIVAQPGSQVTVAEIHVGLTDKAYLNNVVTEVAVQADAVVDHYKIQREGTAGFHVGTTVFLQRENSWAGNALMAVGGTMMRDGVYSVLRGCGAHAELTGLYFTDGTQQMDHHTGIEHAEPNCTSRELYKGVLTDHGKGVFRGKIHVWPDAQKTDAFQKNQNLLLSDTARVDAKPQLEIYADDVRCSHGATFGSLDDTMLFYLRSRGIGQASARDLLTRGFAGAAVDQMRDPSMRNTCEAIMLDWLGNRKALEGGAP